MARPRAETRRTRPMTTRKTRLSWTLPILAATALFGWRYANGSTRPHTPETVKAMRFAPYATQKAVYHVTEGSGLIGHGRYRNLLQIARNHLQAVGVGRLDLRVVLQGDGVELLELAKSDSDLAVRIDALKRDGVRFLICRNTIMGRDLDPAELYGVTAEDIVPAGIAEATSLVQQGYVYLKPLG